MEFVMVPVPEEHVVDVMQYIAKIVARASLEPWDDESAQRLFSEADEATRSLLSVIARATIAGKQISDQDAADTIELHLREVVAIMRDINEWAREANRDQLISLRDTPQLLPNGRTLTRRTFVMLEPVARMVRSAERKAHKREPHRRGAVGGTAAPSTSSSRVRPSCRRCGHTSGISSPGASSSPRRREPTSGGRGPPRPSASCGLSSTRSSSPRSTCSCSPSFAAGSRRSTSR
jgi:hypothetical protein